VRNLVPGLRHDLHLDLVIANGENAAGGKGLTPETADELFGSGIDVLTSGNHIWAQKEIFPLLNDDAPIIRPLNFAPGVPGRGYVKWRNVLVVNLIGRTFMGDADCPFRAMNHLLESLTEKPEAIVVDFHAEATSEKQAMGRYLDGRVTAVVGTHTHVPTSDERVLPKGTAYITDAGMAGGRNAVIGIAREQALQRFLTSRPQRFEPSRDGLFLSGVFIKVDAKTGKALSIVREVLAEDGSHED